MGTILKGVNGGFSGKAGSVIGSSWNGIDYIKGLQRKRTKPFTQEQIVQQARFQTMGKFLFPLKNLLRRGYRSKAQAMQQTAGNVAMRENLKAALTGTYPEFAVDYPNISLSYGSLLVPSSDPLTLSERMLMVNWDSETTEASGHADDAVVILFYNPERNYYFMPKERLQRSDQEAVIEIPRRLTEGTVHGWIFLTDRRQREASFTEYMGSVTIGS